MMCTTKTLVRSLFSGLLLMGVTMAGVPQAGATASGSAGIEAGLTIGLPTGVGVPGVGGDYSFVYGSTTGSGMIDVLDSGSLAGPGAVLAGAISDVSSGPAPGMAFGLGVGIGTTSVANYGPTGVTLPVELSYGWSISGEATTPKDFAAAGVGLFLVVSDYGSTVDFSSIGADLGMDTLDIDGVEIFPVWEAIALDYTSPDFAYGDGDLLFAEYYLGAGEAISVSLVALAGAKANTVPEPASVVLLGSGLVGLVAWRIRKPRV